MANRFSQHLQRYSMGPDELRRYVDQVKADASALLSRVGSAQSQAEVERAWSEYKQLKNKYYPVPPYDNKGASILREASEAMRQVENAIERKEKTAR